VTLGLRIQLVAPSLLSLAGSQRVLLGLTPSVLLFSHLLYFSTNLVICTLTIPLFRLFQLKLVILLKSINSQRYIITLLIVTVLSLSQIKIHKIPLILTAVHPLLQAIIPPLQTLFGSLRRPIFGYIKTLTILRRLMLGPSLRMDLRKRLALSPTSYSKQTQDIRRNFNTNNVLI
jgi:hypothetical protein